MSRHINKLKKCNRIIESYQKFTNLSNIELDNLSLLIIKDKKNNKEETKSIEEIKSNEEIKSIEEINQDLKNENNDKKFKCKLCEKCFTRKDNLQRHVDKNCKNKQNLIEENLNQENLNQEQQNITNNYINNISNISNISNNNILNNNISNNNTIIINVNINKPIPFDSDWDLSKIDNKEKTLLFLSNIKYTKTLEEILKNESNLNVIIDDNSNIANVYKNETENFKELKLKEIVNLTMEKLHKHLSIFHEETKNCHNIYNIENKILDEQKEILDKKLNDYKKDKYIQENVQKVITNIYYNKKDDTLRVCKPLFDQNKNIEGY
jgi:hypothetical protein